MKPALSDTICVGLHLKCEEPAKSSQNRLGTYPKASRGPQTGSLASFRVKSGEHDATHIDAAPEKVEERSSKGRASRATQAQKVEQRSSKGRASRATVEQRSSKSSNLQWQACLKPSVPTCPFRGSWVAPRWHFGTFRDNSWLQLVHTVISAMDPRIWCLINRIQLHFCIFRCVLPHFVTIRGCNWCTQ